MGSMAVLQPQDCLKNPFAYKTLVPPNMKIRRNPIPNPNKSTSRRKRSPPKLDDKRPNNNRKSTQQTVVKDFAAKNLSMGQVKILKRGEDLRVATAAKKSLADLVLPETVKVSKQVRLDERYAGSASIVSPPPSSLPLPLFVPKASAFEKSGDLETDLRRILRLDQQ